MSPIVQQDLVAIFKTYSGDMTIYEDHGPATAPDMIAQVKVVGSHNFVSSVLAMAADAFKEDQER